MKKVFLNTLFFLCTLISFSQDFMDLQISGLLKEYDLKDTSEVSKIVSLILELNTDPAIQSSYLLELGKKLTALYEYNSSDKVFTLCLALAKDTLVMADANFELGLSLSNRDIRKQALKHYQTALSEYTAIGDSLGMGRTLDKIADNHNYIGDHQVARPFYDQSMLIFTAIKDTAALTNVIGNIGGMFSEDGLQDSALFYYEKAMSLNESAENLSNLSHDLSGMGIAFEALNRPQDALKYYQKAYQVAHEGGIELDQAFANQHLGFYYFHQEKYDSAQYYMQITYAYAQKMNFGQLLVNALDVLHQASYQQGQYKAAYDIYKEATQLNDSLLSLENVSLINALRSEYELEKQEAENMSLHQRGVLREEFISRQTRLNNLLVFAAVLLLIALIGLIGLNRTRKRKNQIIENDRDLIKQQADKLKELDQFKSTFFANVAHDYRAPITLIKGFADLVKINEPNLQEETKEYLDQIQETANRMTQMTEEINQLIQLEDSQYTLKPEQININEFFDTLAKMYRLGKKAANINFKYTCDLKANIYILADRSALEKIVVNVIGNAFKYNTTGSIVTLAIRSDQNQLIIEVKDDGPGISPEKIDKIFDRYYRTEKGAELANGLGIGLALAKDLVLLHGGKIRVDSQPNEETIFEISLPLKTPTI